MQIKRRKTRTVRIGRVLIGGNHPIAIQSMVKTKTSWVGAAIRQIKELQGAGCEIVRLAIKDIQDARALKKIKPHVAIPLVADIHFDWRLALEAINHGADKIRLNPGNIYRPQEVKQVVMAAKAAKIPIRVGLNSGSLPVRQAGLPVNGRLPRRKIKSAAEAMVLSSRDYLKMIEGFGFYDIVVSLKASNVWDTLEAYQRMSRICDYPLHLGMTATGTMESGVVKSSISVGYLLMQGIGDTLRVSLTGKPQGEVRVAQYILEALGLRYFGPQIISCPTCGRCEVDLVGMVNRLEAKLKKNKAKPGARPLTVALMGCVVNGPGEAREADLGVAFGKGAGLLFRHGKPVGKVSFANCIPAVIKEIGRQDG